MVFFLWRKCSQESIPVSFRRLKVAIWRSLVKGAVGLFPLENYPEDLSLGTAVEGGHCGRGSCVTVPCSLGWVVGTCLES